LALAFGTVETALAFDRMVVIGDSLSDNGNAGRFSNGPVWVEQLATGLGLTLRPSTTGGSNYAYGGALLDPRSGPTNLRAQTDLYLSRPRPSGHTLHIVFGGGNDLLAAVGASRAEAMVDDAAASMRGIVLDLAENGATDILLPTLPDVGMTPAIKSRGSEAGSQARVLSERFNAAVDQELRELKAHGAVRVHRLDIFGMAERARVDPGAFGFLDVTRPCIALASCEGYLFWDDVHPTTRAHARLAEAAFEMVADR
jgi:outer membrane lipase/esterase